jgi:AcrR family transcriptional regulator
MQLHARISAARTTAQPDGSHAGGNTRDRILTAAEQLFMQHGFEATSMRMITAKAEVNLAAVNYHFGSKERLVEAVFERRLKVLNAERLRLLDALEEAAQGKPLLPAAIIEAFFGVALRMSQDKTHGGRTFIRLLGRAYTEPARFIRDFLAAQYAEVLARFKKALVRSLPHMPTDELIWRMHFMFGTMSYTIAGTDALQLIASCEPAQAEDVDAILRRVIPFLVAGLTAPLSVAAAPNAAHALANKSTPALSQQRPRRRAVRPARNLKKAA